MEEVKELDLQGNVARLSGSQGAGRSTFEGLAHSDLIRKGTKIKAASHAGEGRVGLKPSGEGIWDSLITQDVKLGTHLERPTGSPCQGPEATCMMQGLAGECWREVACVLLGSEPQGRFLGRQSAAEVCYENPLVWWEWHPGHWDDCGEKKKKIEDS